MDHNQKREQQQIANKNRK